MEVPNCEKNGEEMEMTSAIFLYVIKCMKVSTGWKKSNEDNTTTTIKRKINLNKENADKMLAFDFLNKSFQCKKYNNNFVFEYLHIILTYVLRTIFPK